MQSSQGKGGDGEREASGGRVAAFFGLTDIAAFLWYPRVKTWLRLRDGALFDLRIGRRCS
jgi:hypothetical protein